jgi:outer membrane receptor protein involved in Fe transport
MKNRGSKMKQQCKGKKRVRHNYGTRVKKNKQNRRLLAKCSATALSCVSSLAVMPVHAEKSSIEEIVVTATRRDQSVQDVPYNISALSEAMLKRNRVDGFASLSEAIAGFAYINQGPTSRGLQKRYSLRGIQANPVTSGGFFPDRSVAPVSTYYGDHPINFDLTINDLQRVEVLRGPQGTLYGSGSLGGTIRLIPNEPSLGESDANISVENSYTDESGEPNYDFDGVVNFSVGENAAFRVGGGYKHLGGYIDANGLIANTDPGNPFSPPVAAPRVTTPNVDQSGFVFEEPKKDVNDSTTWYIRSQFKYEPSDNFSVLLGYHHEDIQADSQQVVTPDQPSETFSVNDPFLPGIATQNAGGAYLRGYFGLDDVTTYPGTSGEYEHIFPQLTPSEYEVDVYTADVEYDFGFATLTSATSLTKFEGEELLESRGGWVSPGPSGFSFSYYYGNFPRFTTPFINTHDGEDLTQELRLISNWDKPVDFTFGYYYTNQKKSSTYFQTFPGVSEWAQGDNLLTGTGQTSWTAINRFFVVNAHAAYDFNSDVAFDWKAEKEFTEHAVFGELTWHVTPQWQITGGFRRFWQDNDVDMVQLQPLCGAGCSTTGLDPSGRTDFRGSTDQSDHIFKLNTSYDLSENLMVYFNWAEGLRKGGINIVPLTGVFRSLEELQVYDPDKTSNTEIGVKGVLLDKFRFSATVYLIEWTDIQVDDGNSAGFVRVLNGGKADSEGFELEIDGYITENLTFRLAYAYTDASLEEDVEILDYGFGGNRIRTTYAAPKGENFPGSLKNSASWAFDYLYPISDSMGLDFHINGSYRGKTTADYSTQRSFFKIESFTRWDASVSLISEGWAATLFVENLTDELGSTARRPAAQVMAPFVQVFHARPRTVGLRLDYEW